MGEDEQVSRVTELAEAEAQRADAESGDTAETPPPPEPPPEPPPPDAEAEHAKMTQALDKEAQRHARRLGEIMGEDAVGLRPCPLCWQAGFLPPEGVPWPDDERRAAVKAVLGESVEPQYKDAPDAEMCEACDGWGKVATHSKAPGQDTKVCTTCSGQGWKTVVQQYAPPAAVPPPNGQTVGGVAVQPVAGVPDAWGRPAGHPHWGRDPSTVGV